MQDKHTQPQEHPDLSSAFDKDSYFHPFYYYYKRYGRLPHRAMYYNINRKKLLIALRKKYNMAECAIGLTEVYNDLTRKYQYHASAFLIEEGVMIYFCSGRFDDVNSVYLLYPPDKTRKDYKELIIQIKKSVHGAGKELNRMHNFQMDKSVGGEFTPFDIKNTNIDLNKNYNDSFLPVNETIIKRLSEDNSKGIVMLYGKQGAGKTNYIRYLSSQIKKKKLLIPLPFVYMLGAPDMLPLLRQNSNSVLIIEDAENIFQPDPMGNPAVTNITNMMDGLLSDLYNFQVVITINGNLSNIDKSLLSQGRLTAEYEFEELETAKAQALSNELGFKTHITKPMLLSQIYNQLELKSSAVKSKIGFYSKSK